MLRIALPLLAGILATALAPGTALAQAERAQIGALECDVSGGIGFIIASRKEMTCMFTPAGRGPREVYVGSISRFGVDIGATIRGTLLWTVYASTTARHGALAGAYIGASAEASVAIGLGANALIGGSDRTIVLQPVSVQGQAGLNIAAGITELRLTPAR